MKLMAMKENQLRQTRVEKYLEKFQTCEFGAGGGTMERHTPQGL